MILHGEYKPSSIRGERKRQERRQHVERVKLQSQNELLAGYGGRRTLRPYKTSGPAVRQAVLDQVVRKLEKGNVG